MPPKHAILFVCLGNICRSPMAAAIFLHHLRARNLENDFHVESCGTGNWHAGDGADRRAAATLRAHHVPLNHTARQVRPAVDFNAFDWLIPMDEQNYADLLALGANPAKVRLMRSFDPALAGRPVLEVPDPYHGSDNGFEEVYAMLNAACQGLLDECLRKSERKIDQ